MKKAYTIILVAATAALGVFAFAGMPVIDAANLANHQVSHIATIAKWVENIAQLKAQIEQLKTQVGIQSDLRAWAGDPAKAAKALALDLLNEGDLTREYGRARDAIARAAGSLGILHDDDSGVFRKTSQPDLDGNAVVHDPTLYRRYTVLNQRQQNTREVIDAMYARRHELSRETALTLASLRAASTDAEVRKLQAKLTVLNSQLAETENTRRREVDEVVLQQIANESRHEMEQVAAAELRARDDYISSRRVTAFMRTVNPSRK